ncbi:lipid-A-disaccharide synthase-like uncharacterized protein [Paraburkholderia sp. 35.1]
MLFALLRIMRRPIWPPRAAWRLLAAQGLALFCLNFLCFYYAEQVVPSGLVAVVFFTAPLLNSINGRLFMGRPLQPSAIAGALLGLVGIVCLFVQQMAGHLGDHTAWLGLGIAFLGTLCFSAGNLLSSRMQSMGLHPFATNSWAMLIGASILTAGSLLAGFRSRSNRVRALSRRAGLSRGVRLGNRLYRVPDAGRTHGPRTGRVLHGTVSDCGAGGVDGIRRLSVVRVGGGRAVAGGGRQSGGVRSDAADFCAAVGRAIVMVRFTVSIT